MSGNVRKIVNARISPDIQRMIKSSIYNEIALNMKSSSVLFGFIVGYAKNQSAFSDIKRDIFYLLYSKSEQFSGGLFYWLDNGSGIESIIANHLAVLLFVDGFLGN